MHDIVNVLYIIQRKTVINFNHRWVVCVCLCVYVCVCVRWFRYGQRFFVCCDAHQADFLYRPFSQSMLRDVYKFVEFHSVFISRLTIIIIICIYFIYTKCVSSRIVTPVPSLAIDQRQILSAPKIIILIELERRTAKKKKHEHNANHYY